MGKKVSKPVVAPDVKTPQILAEACYEPCEVADLVLLSGTLRAHMPGPHAPLQSTPALAATAAARPQAIPFRRFTGMPM